MKILIRTVQANGERRIDERELRSAFDAKELLQLIVDNLKAGSITEIYRRASNENKTRSNNRRIEKRNEAGVDCSGEGVESAGEDA